MTDVALVLAGGTGSRLYPATRPGRPKQFLALGDDDRSLLARTVDRVAFADETVVVTRPDLADGVRERVDCEVLVEPAARDTGPALAYATRVLAERFDNPTVLVCPSDHHVGDDAAFREALETGARVARETSVVTFGVEPTRPETGYGYVEPGVDRGAYREVDSFHEKPDAETALDYLDRGYLWNAGLFAWRASAFLDVARDSPLAPLVDADDPAAEFDAVAPVSVDHAVVEPAADRGAVAVVPVAFPWDDLGTWDAVGRHAPRDEESGNAVLAPLTAVDATDNVVASDGAHVSLVGVSGLAVAAYDDRVLVVPRDRADDVRDLVDRLRDEGRW